MIAVIFWMSRLFLCFWLVLIKHSFNWQKKRHFFNVLLIFGYIIDAMNTTRTITHDSNHTDIETYLKDADGVWMWAVTQCNGGKAMTETTYTFEHAIKMLKQAIEFGEAEGDYSRVRVWAYYVEEAHNADIAAEQELTRSANEGAKLMYSLSTGDDVTKLLNDWQLNANAEEADYKDLKETERSQLP